MHILLLWSCAVNHIQFLLGSKSKDQKEDLKQENKGGSSDPREQFDATKEASNVAQEQSAKTQKSGSRKRRRVAVILPEHQPGESTKVSKAVSRLSPSPRQLEEATDQETGLADQVRFQTQVAMVLLTLSAGAIISAKGTTFTRQAGQQPAAGRQSVNLQDFFFWWSIGLWLSGLLFTVFIVLVTTFQQNSPGLLIYAKRVNAFNLCVSVLGVACWIFS